jgi:plastocyanin
MSNRLLRSGAALALLATLAAAPALRAEGGTLKGEVVWAGDVPTRDKLVVDKDQAACLKNGPLLSDKYVVDPKTKGVEWVVVWLSVPGKPAAPLPMPESVAKAKGSINLDQPTCQFEPHVIALRAGQTLNVKNTASVPHNINVQGGVQGPNQNQIIPPGGRVSIGGFKAKATAPVSVSCTIHGWMKGYIWVFNHPYFAVTKADGSFEIKDAPAGTWNMIVWHEEKGWDSTAGGKAGTPVTIKAGETTDVGKVELK